MDHTDVYRLVSEVYAAERVDVLEMEALDGVIAQLEGDIKSIEVRLPALRAESAASRRALSDQRLATQQSHNQFVEFVESSLFPACQRCVCQPPGATSTEVSLGPLSSLDALKDWDSARLDRISSWVGSTGQPPTTHNYSSILSLLRTTPLLPPGGGSEVSALQFIDQLSKCLPPQAVLSEGPLITAVRAITDALATIPSVATARSNVPVPTTTTASAATSTSSEAPKRQRGDDRSALSFLKGGDARHPKYHSNTNTRPPLNQHRQLAPKPAEAPPPAPAAPPRQLAEVDDDAFVAANSWTAPTVARQVNTTVLSSLNPNSIYPKAEPKPSKPPNADVSTTKVKKSRHTHQSPPQWSFPDAADVSFAFHKGM